MAAISEITREVYIPSPAPGVAPAFSCRYLGAGLRREETKSYARSSDWADETFKRYSEDNGKTWSEWTMLEAKRPTQGNFTKEEGPFATCFDPVSRHTIQTIFQRVLIGEGPEALSNYWKGQKSFYDHGFYQISKDNGRTWSRMKLLKYEEGHSFDPENWGDKEFLEHNEMYGGYNMIILRNGDLTYTATIPAQHQNEDGTVEQVAGVICFVGRWDPNSDDYEWIASKPVTVSHRISGRGLLEPCVAELSNGNLLLAMRGSNHVPRAENWKGAVQSPGRKWVSISKDGGLTWSEVPDLRYENGEQFYSPSSFCTMIRSNKTEKLYWIGNICPLPPDGNLPRYPLYIAEMDEIIPALKRDTLTVIDDRKPHHLSDIFQLSNYCIIENRETLDFELYMTHYGEKGSGKEYNEVDCHTANCYKYVLTIL